MRVFNGRFRGGSGGSHETPSGTKLSHFHWEIHEKSGEMLETNPLLIDLKPASKNPGSSHRLYFHMVHVIYVI